MLQPEVEPMSLRYALLGLLEDGPASGYALTGRFERSLRRYAWSAQQSHIYPELKRLAAEGLISTVEQGRRGRRTYAITNRGRAELRDWLTAPAKPRAIRDERMLRMCLLSALDLPDARKLVLSFMEEAKEELARLRALVDAADAESHPRGRLRFGRLAAEYGLHSYAAVQRWGRWTLEQLEQAERRQRKRKAQR
jgi:DNA-binding PadR family transcriptional regulator